MNHNKSRDELERELATRLDRASHEADEFSFRLRVVLEEKSNLTDDDLLALVDHACYWVVISMIQSLLPPAQDRVKGFEETFHDVVEQCYVKTAYAKLKMSTSVREAIFLDANKRIENLNGLNQTIYSECIAHLKSMDDTSVLASLLFGLLTIRHNEVLLHVPPSYFDDFIYRCIGLCFMLRSKEAGVAYAGSDQSIPIDHEIEALTANLREAVDGFINCADSLVASGACEMENGKLVEVWDDDDDDDD